jgi:hypothetical protein
MTLTLPEPIAAYFAADRQNGEAVARCFTSDAIVKDEGRSHRGIAAIKRWKDEADAKFDYTVAPLSLEQKDSVSIVTCHLTGTFPGSPVDLRYFFRLERGKISSLEVVP